MFEKKKGYVEILALHCLQLPNGTAKMEPDSSRSCTVTEQEAARTNHNPETSNQIEGKNLSWTVVKHWNRLPRKALEPPFSETSTNEQERLSAASSKLPLF